MQRVGLIGGTGWPATRDYYEQINRLVHKRLGGLHSANLLIWSFDFQEVLDKVNVPGAMDQQFLSAGIALQAAGAQVLALASNTGHLFVKAWQPADLPLVHIAEVCARSLAQAGVTRVGILATQLACQGGVFTSHFAAAGIALVYLNAKLAQSLDDAIFGELETGAPGLLTHDALIQAAKYFTDQGVHEVLLGCTELRLSLMPEEIRVATQSGQSAIRFWDSTDIHCAAIVDAALQPSAQVTQTKQK